jgi:hypothetical protein
MGEAADQVKQEAAEARQRLAQDLNRLEYRVQAMRDWRSWFREYPAAFLGAGFVGALLLGFAIWPRRA